MKKLYFVRHGLSEMNVAGLRSGHSDTLLTDTGRAQAKAAAADVKGLKIDLIVSSPLSRALETARIIAQEIGYPVDKIVTNELFIERDFGSLEGVEWAPDVDFTEHEGVELDHMLVARAEKAIAWLQAQPAEVILVAAHGAIGRALRHVVKEEFPMSHPHRMKNAEIHELL